MGYSEVEGSSVDRECRFFDCLGHCWVCVTAASEILATCAKLHGHTDLSDKVTKRTGTKAVTLTTKELRRRLRTAGISSGGARKEFVTRYDEFIKELRKGTISEFRVIATLG